MDITPFLPLITGAIGGAATNVFKGPVKTLEDWWYVTYGYELSEKASLLKAQLEINVKKLQESTLKNVSKVKPENIQEPKLNILGPALEASRFYIEEDELREMFAKIIASSMDKEKNSVIHPSFVEVIKQLSVNDALFLQEFKNSTRLPYGKILAIENKKNSRSLSTFENDKDLTELKKITEEIHNLIPSDFESFQKEFGQKSYPVIEFFYYSISRDNISDNELSISSLSRLGLINVREETQLADAFIYQELENQFDIFKGRSEMREGAEIIPKGFHPELRKGTIDLTAFGSAFFTICV